MDRSAVLLAWTGTTKLRATSDESLVDLEQVGQAVSACPFHEVVLLSDFAQAQVLRALEGMGDAATFADEIAGFHAHQPAEKALKAWLALKDVEYPRTHDLRRLLDLLQTTGEDVTALVDLVEYTDYAVLLRYESPAPDAEPLDRLLAVCRLHALCNSRSPRSHGGERAMDSAQVVMERVADINSEEGRRRALIDHKLVSFASILAVPKAGAGLSDGRVACK
jgi:HEPN domain-containing protein